MGRSDSRSPPSNAAMPPFGSPDFVALHRAILDNPGADAPRFDLAEWYCRTGKRARGESLRLAVVNRESMRGPLPGPFAGQAIISRGFVEQVVLDLDTFLVHGAEIFGDHPIVRVEFSDLDPEPDLFGPGTWGWITGFAKLDEVDIDRALVEHALAMLPFPLADLIGDQAAVESAFTGKVYATKDDAVESLSRAAVRVGREEAGLPPLADVPTVVTTTPGATVPVRRGPGLPVD